MKKFSCLMLVLMMLFSLSACSGGPSPEEMEKIKKYEKYENLISLLEKEAYAAAIADVEARMPEPTAPEFTEVKITMDNWKDYFDVLFIEDWHINGFGESEGLETGHKLVVKDKWKDKLANIENIQIDIEWSVDATYYYCDYDLDNRTYATTSKVDRQDQFAGASDSTGTNTIKGKELLSTEFDYQNIDPNRLTFSYLFPKTSDRPGALALLENFEILNMQGSIFLTE